MEFQNIKNFLAKVDENTYTTILITFIIFFLGYLFNWLSKQLSEFGERRLYRQLVKTSLLNLTKQINKQAVHLTNLANGLDIDGVGATNFDYIILYDLSLISEVPYITLKTSFLDGWENKFKSSMSVKDFNVLINSVKYLSIVNDDIVNEGKRLFEEFSQLNELRNNELTNVQRNVEKFRINAVGRYNCSEPIGTYFRERENIIARWRKKDDYITPTNVQLYLQELLNLNRSNVEVISENEELVDSTELNISINLATMRYENMVNFMNAKKSQFLFYARQYYLNKDKLFTIYKGIK
ncbi:hypothetical protein ACFE6N_22855 [Pedobacter sp. BG31]|uniref:hypothetical protein n=1 Tax=Pedobacter sp. BG31 TaxID=3349697 RepID=UPI0035F41414